MDFEYDEIMNLTWNDEEIAASNHVSIDMSSEWQL